MIDDEFCGGKLYRPEIDDPEFCCADGTLCYDFTMIQLRNNPQIIKLVNEIILTRKR